jgi:hypothetical protein
MPAPPWKSGASASRKAFRIVRASALVVAFRAPGEAIFRSLFAAPIKMLRGASYQGTASQPCRIDAKKKGL